MFIGKIHYKWPFSIAMLNYQREKTYTYIIAFLMGSEASLNETDPRWSKLGPLLKAIQWWCGSAWRRPSRTTMAGNLWVSDMERKENNESHGTSTGNRWKSIMFLFFHGNIITSESVLIFPLSFHRFIYRLEARPCSNAFCMQRSSGTVHTWRLESPYRSCILERNFVRWKWDLLKPTTAMAIDQS